MDPLKVACKLHSSRASKCDCPISTQVYLSLRAKGTPPRREKVNELLAGIGKCAMDENGHCGEQKPIYIRIYVYIYR